MAIKVYFPEVLGSDSLTYLDGRMKNKHKINQAIINHCISMQSINPAFKTVTHAVYSRNDKIRLDLLERLGRVVYIHSPNAY